MDVSECGYADGGIVIVTAPDARSSFVSSFRDGPKDRTRNLEIPGSMLRIAPE
jgi:hypothetical protein